MLSYERSFIEAQFPVSKVSKESYKERKAVQSQTLTGLGKWWGRKPLFLVRATLLGLLLPVSNNPSKDRDMFLKILTMDEEGLLLRKSKSIPTKVLYELSTESERREFFNTNNKSIKIRNTINREKKLYLQKLIFSRMSYDEKLLYCVRPEELNNLPLHQWDEINKYYNTNANDITEFLKEISFNRFQKKQAYVGDCFCGGGSIPFESMRLGFNTHASDLNPVAGLLTWASLNINSKSNKDVKQLELFQERVFKNVDQEVTKLRIEHNEDGDRANTYLYCNEANCPECIYKVPLATTWLVGKTSKVVAELHNNNSDKTFDIKIVSNATFEQMKKASETGTIKSGNMICPNCNTETPIPSLRKDRRGEDGNTIYGLRQWKQNEFIASNSDVYSERLYCIRYEKEVIDAEGNISTERYFKAPDNNDKLREIKVIDFINDHFEEWRLKGYIPVMEIEEGYNTNQLIRERGWRFWHQLFNPRQLLLHGMLMEAVDKLSTTKEEKVIGLLGVNRCSNWNSKLCSWGVGAARESIAQTFYNQALNTIYNYGCKGLNLLKSNWKVKVNNFELNYDSEISLYLSEASQIAQTCDIWITDPPYADAVNYHELSEFFLAWDNKMLKKIFPDWYTDSKRVLAIKGIGEDFNRNMIKVYRHLSNKMPDNGMQVVMFTHQDVSVWADLALILWSSGLRVTAAWNIATETETAGLKDGNYVKGTVLLVLRKQNSEETAYLDELYPEIEEEVKSQIDSMRDLDDKEDPNFTDSDYLLSAYAASLKILTSYKRIEDIDVNYELSKNKDTSSPNAIEKIINEAIKIAFDYLTPSGFDPFTWKTMSREERFYIKGLDFEKENVYQIGIYQELARGFGVRNFQQLLSSTRANQTRLKTAKEFAMRTIGDMEKFNSSLLRNILAALYQSIKAEDTNKGRNWLKNEVPNYWNQRTTIIKLLNFISTIGHHEHMKHWQDEAKYARLLSELVKNDGV